MILNRQRRVRLARKPLESFLRMVRRELKLKNSEVTICFVSDAEIARMNRTFRRKNGPTDVLSFPNGTRQARIRGKRPGRSPQTRQGRTKNGERDYLGDVAISPSIARRNAREYQRPLANELKILMLHGMLHLLGYDHETDCGEMDRIERRLRKRFGLA